MSKYRFKTEEEFKKEGRWGEGAPKFWVTVMNKYLGKDIPDSYNTICDKQEQLHYETWSFNPKDYVLKETAFVLPSKWCVKVDRDCQPEEVYKWRKMSWIDAGYIDSSTIWDNNIPHNYTEITLEQFRQYVLKLPFVVESPKEESIPEYVECVRSSSGGFTVGKIYNWPNPIDDKGVKRPIGNIHGAIWGFKPSTKEAYDAQYTPKQLTKEDLVEGEIYLYDDSHISTYPVGPSVSIVELNYNPNERWMWNLSITHATEEQKALLRSYMKKDEKQEWSEGTYAVGVKGNFGVFDSSNPISVGQIYTIKVNRETYVVVKESEYWVYKHNLNWFATYQEALDFSNQLKASPVPKESDTSELTPLEICKQKYRKGMRVMSADNSGMFSGEFTIGVDPDKFTITGAGVDYHNSKGWLYMGGKYAEILEDNACEISSHEPFIKEVVKTQPNEELIKPIYSVNIDLVVKNKKNKIIF